MATTRCPKLMCMMRSASQWSLPLAQLPSNSTHTFGPKMPWSNICPICEAWPWALLQYASPMQQSLTRSITSLATLTWPGAASRTSLAIVAACRL